MVRGVDTEMELYVLQGHTLATAFLNLTNKRSGPQKSLFFII